MTLEPSPTPAEPTLSAPLRAAVTLLQPAQQNAPPSTSSNRATSSAHGKRFGPAGAAD